MTQAEKASARMQSTKVVPGEVYVARRAATVAAAQAEREAEVILAAAQTGAAALLTRAREQATALREAAVAQGAAQAQAECAALLTAAIAKWQTHLASLVPQLHRMLTESLRAYLDSTPDALRLTAAVRAGMAALDGKAGVDMYVHPDGVQALAAHLDALRCAYPQLNVISVQGDARLAPAACRLVTPTGELHASEADYLQAVQRVLQGVAPHCVFDETVNSEAGESTKATTCRMTDTRAPYG